MDGVKLVDGFWRSQSKNKKFHGADFKYHNIGSVITLMPARLAEDLSAVCICNITHIDFAISN